MTIQIDPSKGQGEQLGSTFGTAVFSLNPNEVAEVKIPFSSGHFFISTMSLGHHMSGWCRGSSAMKYGGGIHSDILTTVLTGMTGADGKMSVSAVGNILYIENRQTTIQQYNLTLIGVSKVLGG